MYLEKKDGKIDGVAERIGWVTFSKFGHTVYYQGKTIKRAIGGGIPETASMQRLAKNIGFQV